MLRYLMIVVVMIVIDALAAVYLNVESMEYVELIIISFVVLYCGDRDKFKRIE